MWKKVALICVVVIIAVVCVAAYSTGFVLDSDPIDPPAVSSIYDFTMKNIDGENVKLNTYQGKVLLIVNTASKCGFTPQYEGLQGLYDKYKDQGFVILGFPANNFLWQEPGNNKEIKEFCSLKYKVTFPMFAKVSVKGKAQDPLYTYLTNKVSNPSFPGSISWNFEKFLIGKDGKILARFSPSTKPDDPKVIDALEKALK